MVKRAWFLFGGMFAAVAILAGTGVFLFYEPEPGYNRRSLSQWLTICRSSSASQTEREEATLAVRHIGTNALHLLISRATKKQTHNREKLRFYLAQHPIARKLTPKSVRAWADKWPDETQSNEAKLGMLILGPAAAPAIPELDRLARTPPATPTTYWAIEALGNIGAPALPTLIAIAQDPKVRWRSIAIRQISNLGSAGAPAFPAIILLLNDPQRDVAQAAAQATGDLTLNSELSVPALVNCLYRNEPDLRLTATLALARFGPNARQAIPDLLNTLNAETNQLRQMILTRAICGIDPNAIPKPAP